MQLRLGHILLGFVHIVFVSLSLLFDSEEAQRTGRPRDPFAAAMIGILLVLGLSLAAVSIWKMLLSILQWRRSRSVAGTGRLPRQIEKVWGGTARVRYGPGAPMNIRLGEILYGLVYIVFVSVALVSNSEEAQRTGSLPDPFTAAMAGIFLAVGFSFAVVSIWKMLLSIFRWWQRRSVPRTEALSTQIEKVQGQPSSGSVLPRRPPQTRLTRSRGLRTYGAAASSLRRRVGQTARMRAALV